jgi:DNA-binding NarL/FixJ family response regulator
MLAEPGSILEIMMATRVEFGPLGSMLATIERTAPVAAAASPPFRSLSPREWEVLALVADGQPNKRIAREMNLAEASVKHYISAMLRKLDFESRTDAAVAFTRWRTQLNIGRPPAH